jgi:hypothetical protein
MSCFKTLTVGSDLSALDIFLSVDGVPINASGVAFAVLDAADNIATYGSGVNVSTGKYTASGVVLAGYQLGEWQIDWTILPAGGGLMSATEEFCVQALDISFGFTPPEDTTASIYQAVLLDVGDPNQTIFNENYLRQVLVKAVRRLNQALGLGPQNRPTGVPGTFGGRRIQIPELVADVETGTITPNTNELVDMVVLQMTYIILTAEVSSLKRLLATGPTGSVASAAGRSEVSVQNPDGVNVSLGTGNASRFGTQASLHKFDADRIKQELDAAVKRYLGRATGSMGKLVW